MGEFDANGTGDNLFRVRGGGIQEEHAIGRKKNTRALRGPRSSARQRPLSDRIDTKDGAATLTREVEYKRAPGLPLLYRRPSEKPSVTEGWVPSARRRDSSTPLRT